MGIGTTLSSRRSGTGRLRLSAAVVALVMTFPAWAAGSTEPTSAGGPLSAPYSADQVAVPSQATGAGRQMAGTANWPEFQRGGRHQGFNPFEKKLTRATVGRLRVAWRFDNPSGCTSYSGPTVADGRVYVGNYCPYLYAVDERTGRLLWTATTDGKVESAPAVADGRVFVATGYTGRGVYAFDAASGERLWRYEMTDGSLGSPSVRHGVLYVAAEEDGALYALEAATGKPLWRSVVPGWAGGSAQSPLVVGGTVYVGSTDGYLYAFDAVTGQTLWRGATGGPIHRSSVIAASGHVFVGSDGGTLVAFPLSGCGESTCQPSWRSRSLTPGTSTAAAAYGRVYVTDSDGYMNAFSARGCDALLCPAVWRTALGGVNDRAPAVAGGVVYATSARNRAVTALDTRSGAVLWRFTRRTEYGGNADVSVANGRLFVNFTWTFKLFAFQVAQE
jgi:outer membrane protein assembly factor BamB